MQSWALCFHYTFNVFLTCEIFCQFRRWNNKTKNFISQEFKSDYHSKDVFFSLYDGSATWVDKPLLYVRMFVFFPNIIEKQIIFYVWTGAEKHW